LQFLYFSVFNFHQLIVLCCSQCNLKCLLLHQPFFFLQCFEPPLHNALLFLHLLRVQSIRATKSLDKVLDNLLILLHSLFHSCLLLFTLHHQTLEFWVCIGLDRGLRWLVAVHQKIQSCLLELGSRGFGRLL
jgi:hypothetical protein